MFGYIDTDPEHWGYCALCSERKYRGQPGIGVFYCITCRTVTPLGTNDVIDAHDILKRTLTGKGLMVILKIKEVHFV